MKYAFFSDIDNTIYDYRQTPSQETIADVMWAKNHHIEFVMATGNGYFNSIKALAHKFGSQYLILNNGALIYDHVNQKTLYQNMIPQVIAQQILDVAIELNITTQWWGDNEDFYFSHQSCLKRVEKTKKFIWQDIVKFDQLIHHDIYKIELVESSNLLDQAVKLIQHLPVNIIRMKGHQIEIVNQNVSKAHGIEVFCKMFNLDLKNVGAIGDSYNDLEMLSLIKHSYAVDNAAQQVKHQARFTTTHALENGVGKAIRDFASKILKT